MARKYVTVAKTSVRSKLALREPTFIIKKGSVYYVTVALWEYDSTAATTPKQVAGCNNVAAQFALPVPPGAPPLDVREQPPGKPGGGGEATNPQNP